MLQFDVERCRIGSNLGGVVDSERTYYTPPGGVTSPKPVITPPKHTRYDATKTDVGRSSSPALRGLFLRELM